MEGDAPVERDAEPVTEGVAVPDTAALGERVPVGAGVAAPSDLRASRASGTASATTRMRRRQNTIPTTARRFTRGGAAYRYAPGLGLVTRLGSSETTTTSEGGETSTTSNDTGSAIRRLEGNESRGENGCGFWAGGARFARNRHTAGDHPSVAQFHVCARGDRAETTRHFWL